MGLYGVLPDYYFYISILEEMWLKFFGGWAPDEFLSPTFSLP